jgi:hypothetical protein
MYWRSVGPTRVRIGDYKHVRRWKRVRGDKYEHGRRSRSNAKAGAQSNDGQIAKRDLAD